MKTALITGVTGQDGSYLAEFCGFSSEKGGEVAAAWLTFIETCKLQKKAAFDFFNDFFKKVTEGRSDYELIAQEVLG